ncbi:MAG: hypothetical protein CMB29_06150 [Euryarchaeota archaeon]|nr:hypothetical protein [Euryarchaeota archaeon]DAC31868.1 MAG TPA: PRC-barrel domain containing protein [Candidatus Poseidoniales archaeon]
MLTDAFKDRNNINTPKRHDIMAVFANEVMGRDVVDSHNEKLGEISDLVIDKLSGSVTQIVVILEGNLDPTLLPWDYRDGRMMIPIDDVARIANRIHLRK